MNLLVVLAIPSVLSLLVMGAIITREVYIGGIKWPR
jgi:hypothetical protein